MVNSVRDYSVQRRKIIPHGQIFKQSIPTQLRMTLLNKCDKYSIVFLDPAGSKVFQQPQIQKKILWLKERIDICIQIHALLLNKFGRWSIRTPNPAGSKIHKPMP